MEGIKILLNENTLKKYIPVLFEFMGGQNISWSSINEGYLVNREKRRSEFHQNGGWLRDEVNFYKLIGKVEVDKDSSSEKFLGYINVVLERLNESLTKREKIMVGKIIRNFLKSFSLDYIHYIGELFFLDKLIRSQEYKLIEVEHTMINGKQIDFKLYSLTHQMDVLIEIMNVRLWDLKLDSRTVFKEQLTNKVERKIHEKNGRILSDNNFHVQSILWGSGGELRKISNFYKTGLCIEGVTEPFSYGCFSNENDETKPRYVFEKISTLFDSV
jgi:hypothetical protein